MKTGYAIWSIGWLCLALGIGLLIWGLVIMEFFAIGRGVICIAVSPMWFKWGRQRIQKAVMEQLTEGKGQQ